MGSEAATSEHELTLQSTPAAPARTAEGLVGFRPWMWQCGSVRRGSKRCL